MKCEDNTRDHQSEAAALTHVISQLHAVHMDECEVLKDELSEKDDKIERVRIFGAFQLVQYDSFSA